MMENGKMIILQSEWDKREQKIRESALQEFNRTIGDDPGLANRRNLAVAQAVSDEKAKYDIWDDTNLGVLLDRMGHVGRWLPDAGNWWSKLGLGLASGDYGIASEQAGAEFLEPPPMSATKKYKDYAKLMKEDPTGSFKKYLAESGLRGADGFAPTPVDTIVAVPQVGEIPTKDAAQTVGLDLPGFPESKATTYIPPDPSTVTTTTADDPLITEIFTTFYSPDWQSRIGDITNKIMASMKYSEIPDPSTGEKVLTADSLRRYNIYHSQLEAAQEREAADQKFRADLKRAQSTTEAGADLQRHLGDQRYRQAILTKILDDPFKYRAATGQGMYLGPQNLGDYNRMDPFRKGQYGADLGLIGETPETIGRMVTPATFAERSAPMLTSLPSWRRLD